MKKPQHISFKFSPIATAVAIAITSQFIGNIASAGTGFGSGLNLANSPVAVPTYYANSPSGPIPFYDANGVQQIRTDGSALPVTAPSGTLLRARGGVGKHRGMEVGDLCRRAGDGHGEA